MIRVNAKTNRGRRVLKKREPQPVEGPKTAIFARGSTSSQIVGTALKDLYLLKKPDALLFSKRNEIHPFDDEKPLEFFSQKNDAHLFVVANHSKKRPHNLVFARSFDYRMLDMMELGIEKAVPMSEFKNAKFAVGKRPCIVFNGDLFATTEEYGKMRNMFLDFFRGEPTDAINLGGLEHVISITADSESRKIYFRVYGTQMMKSGTRLPRIELQEIGPSLDFVLRRTRFAPDDVLKLATKIPKELKVTKEKNVERDVIGDKYGRIHMHKQDFSKLQTRKMKGLKRGAAELEGEDGESPKKKSKAGGSRNDAGGAKKSSR
ncbi:Brix domain-containing protein [Cladochytrium replicatum]|nr:Brix domain-containing protein [Cladochytrium replicatum]